MCQNDSRFDWERFWNTMSVIVMIVVSWIGLGAIVTLIWYCMR